MGKEQKYNVLANLLKGMVDAKKQLNQEASREDVIESVRSSVISAVSQSQ